MKKLVVLLGLVLAITVLPYVTFPMKVYGDSPVTVSEIFYAPDGDGHLTKSGGAPYSSVYDSTPADTVVNETDFIQVGRQVIVGIYSVFRSFLTFNTSSLPDFVTVTSATLNLYGQTDSSATDFDILLAHNLTTPHIPLTAADFDIAFYSLETTTFNTASFTTAGYNTILFPSGCLSWVNQTGITRLGVFTDTATPTAIETIQFYAYEKGAGYRPYLNVTYSYVSVEVESYPTGISANITRGGSPVGSITTGNTYLFSIGTYVFTFPSTVVRAGLTRRFYCIDNYYTNRTHTITISESVEMNVTYVCYQPIPFTDTEPVFESGMSNVFELDGILEGQSSYYNMLLDTSPYENHGRLYPTSHPYSGATVTWGIHGKGLYFDGVDDYVNITSSESLNCTYGITVSFWFKSLNVTPNQKIISKFGNNGEWIMGVINGKIYSELWTDSGTLYGSSTNGITVRDNVFYHVSLSYDCRDGYYSVLISGVPNFIVATDGEQIRLDNSYICIGAYQGTGYWFNGVIDDLRIYDYKVDFGQVNVDSAKSIVKFGTYDFTHTGYSNDGATWTTQDGYFDSDYVGTTDNDPILVYAVANDSHKWVVNRNIRYIAGFQSLQLYCNITYSVNQAVSNTGNIISWYWNFFRHGLLQSTFEIRIKCSGRWWEGYSTWYVDFVRKTPYGSVLNLSSWSFNSATMFEDAVNNSTVFPAIIYAFVGGDNTKFTIRIDAQDSRLWNGSDSGSHSFPWSYSYDLVDADLTPRKADWFDGWIVCGNKAYAHTAYATGGQIHRIEISGHLAAWYEGYLRVVTEAWNSVTSAFQPFVDDVLGFFGATGENPATGDDGNPLPDIPIEIPELPEADSLLLWMEDIIAKLTPTSDSINNIVKLANDTTVNALAGISHQISSSLSKLGTSITTSLGSIPTALSNIGGAFAGGLINYASQLVSNFGKAMMGFGQSWVPVLDRVSGWFGYPTFFTDILAYISVLYAYLANSVSWVYSMLSNLFVLLGQNMAKFITVISMWTGVLYSFFQNTYAFLDGTYTAGISVYTDLGIANWITVGFVLYPIYLLTVWERHGTEGLIIHLTFVKDVLFNIFSLLFKIAETAYTFLFRLIEAIPLAE